MPCTVIRPSRMRERERCLSIWQLQRTCPYSMWEFLSSIFAHRSHDSNECCICLESLRWFDFRKRRCKVCRTMFHEVCIRKWETQQSSCPICRKRRHEAPACTPCESMMCCGLFVISTSVVMVVLVGQTLYLTTLALYEFLSQPSDDPCDERTASSDDSSVPGTALEQTIHAAQ